MTNDILKIVGGIAGIGGLALGVFLLVAKELIQKAIFPTLTKQQSSRIIIAIAFMAWTTALAGIGAWTYISIHPPNSNNSENNTHQKKIKPDKIKKTNIIKEITHSYSGTYRIVPSKIDNYRDAESCMNLKGTYFISVKKNNTGVNKVTFQMNSPLDSIFLTPKTYMEKDWSNSVDLSKIGRFGYFFGSNKDEEIKIELRRLNVTNSGITCDEGTECGEFTYWNFTKFNDKGYRSVKKSFRCDITFCSNNQSETDGCFDLCGKLRWKSDYRRPIAYQPLVDNGLIFFGSGDYFYAVNMETGRKKWKFNTKNHITSSPFKYHNSVYIGNNSRELYSIDMQSGKQNKKINGIKISGNTIINNNVLYFSNGSEICSFDMETEKTIWKFSGVNQATCPIIYKGVLYFGNYNKYLYAFDEKTKREKWKFKACQPITSPPAVIDDIVYFVSASVKSDEKHGGFLYAIDSNTGNEKWRFKVGDVIFNKPIIDKNTLYFGGNDECLYALDSQTGVERWRFQAKRTICTSPVVDSGILYFGCKDNYLYSLYINSGMKRWKFQAEDWLTHPTIINEVIYFGDWDGYLYSLML